MAKLPDPQLILVEVTWPDDHKEREKSFFEILGQAIRKRAEDEKRKKEDKEE